MSMFGWSAGDLLQFARLAKDVLNYYQSVPQNLRDSLERLEYVANHLEDLSDVLQKSGWPGYNRAPMLGNDLDKAKSFFARYASLSAATTVSTSRILDTARLGLGEDKGKLRRIDENLKDHLEKMSAFKQHVILICSLRNLDLAQRPEASSPGPAGHVRPGSDDGDDDITTLVGRSNTLGSWKQEADNISVISNAFSAIQLASKLKKSSGLGSLGREPHRSQPPLEPVSPTSPVLDALKAATKQKVIDEFIDEIVNLSEELQLYSQNPSLPRSPQQLAKITSTAMKLCDTLRPQRRGSTMSPRLSLPEVESPIESFRESVFSTLSRNSDNRNTTEATSDLSNSVETSLAFTNETMSSPNIDTGPAGDVEPSPRQVQRAPEHVLASKLGTSIVDIGPPAKQTLAFTVNLLETSIVGAAPIECTLDFAEAIGDGRFCSVTATAVNQRRGSLSCPVNRESLALTPQTQLGWRENDSIHDIRESTEYSRVFHHNFLPEGRPIPHILHPAVEGPSNELDAPYTINFASPQLFEEEGVPWSATRTTSLKYIFSTKGDRDNVQSLIFGKTLLFSAGINEVSTTGSIGNSSHDQQAVRLWLSKDGINKSITVYFKDSKTGQKLYKEYQTLGLHSDMFKGERLKKLKSRAPVHVLIIEIRGTTVNPRRRSSATSAQTSSSVGSADSVIAKRQTCHLYFSNDIDRAEFLELLK